MDAPDVIALIAIAVTIGTQWAATARWRGRIDSELAQAAKDREILHGRIGDKEAALETQLKELTAVVAALRIEVARLSERLSSLEKR